MKNFLFLLLFPIISFGQTLSVPTSQEVPIGVAGIGISGFSLSGYNSTSTYKVSISVSGSAGSTFSIGTTTGLTRDYGYYSWTNITAVNFTGTPSNIENGLNSIKLNTTSTLDGLINLSVVINNQQTNTYYNPTNGHMYKFVQGPITWASARTNSKASTFDGEPGYLVTITSADEQNFVNSKVSAYNIWTGLSDENQEGYWKWMDGPEAGTVIRIGSTDQSGKYNNWASGEPNNWGSGEDYMVMKWSGGTQWNDFGPPATTSTSQIGGYLIEYGTWTDPTQSTFNTAQQTQITFTQKNIPYLTYKFNFDSEINPTEWSGMVHYEESQNQYTTTHTTPLVLSANGYINATPQVFPKGPDGTKKATTVGGQVEWCVIYSYDATNKRYRVGVDSREFTNQQPNWDDVKSLQLFDLWDGPVTPNSGNNSSSVHWNEYWIYTDTQFDFTNSNYLTYIRSGNGYHALRAEFSFEDNEVLPNQSWIFTSKTENEVQQMVDDMVSVSDVILAFNELAGGGLNGGLKGDLAPIQLILGDVTRDGVFDFQDTYRMLQHLQGTNSLLDVNSLAYFMIIREKSIYDSYTFSTWPNGSWTTMMAASKMTESSPVQQLTYSVGFKGDVNLSHSATAPGVQITSKQHNIKTLSRTSKSVADVILEIDNKDEIIVTLTIPENSLNLVGTQFRVGYDNSKLKFSRVEYSSSNFQNFQSTRSDYINIGSILTNGSQTLNQGISYKLYFKPNMKLESTLGLLSILKTEAIDSTGENLEIIVK